MLVLARPGHIYVELDAGALVTAVFAASDRPSWDDDEARVLDVTGIIPRPQVGQVWDGRQFKPAPVPPTATEIQTALTNAVQGHLDATARLSGYDNIFTACTYAEEPAVPRFQLEGRAFRQWRSLVWGRCHQVMGEVQGGLRPIPTAAELIAELPAYVAPQL